MKIRNRKILLFVMIMSALTITLRPPGTTLSVQARPSHKEAIAPPPPLTVHPDFNGDGFVDLAIGVPDEDVDGPDGFEVTNAGLVNIIYGSGSGLSADNDVMLHQDSEIAGIQIRGLAEVEDYFGAALATGNFNGDAYTDLAIGIPGEDVPGSVNQNFSDAGAVQILYGSPDGLTATDNQLWHQDSDGIESVAQNNERFGAALAAGDFDGDGKDDLAIGVPGDRVNGNIAAGAVNILYGTANLLSATDNKLWSQDSDDIEGVPQPGEQFGAALAAGDFDGNGRDDLAIGVPKESVSGLTDAGAVNVLYASVDGLSSIGDQIWHQNIKLAEVDVIGMAEAGDLFGSALAAGDFSGDGRDDLAIGVPGEEVSGIASAGAVNVLYAFGTKLIAHNNQIWHQDRPQIENSPGAFDKFGAALAAGDFNDDGRSDLAIGVPGETVSGFGGAGAVNVLYASANSLSSTNNKLWHQDIIIGNVHVVGVAQFDDRFGAALATGDFNNDGRDDLAIGVPREDVDGVTEAGAMNILFGTSVVTGLAVTGNQMWHQNSAPGGVPIAGSAQTADHFGSALGAK